MDKQTFITLTKSEGFPSDHLLSGVTKGKDYLVMDTYGKSKMIMDDQGYQVWVSNTVLKKHFKEVYK